MRQRAALLDGDGDAVLRKAVDEVRRAVQRIDDPAAFGFLRGGAGLFRQETVVGIGLAHHVHDRFLRRPVHLRHIVVDALGLHLQRAAVERRAIDDGAGAARRAHRDVEHGMHGGAVF